MQRETVVIVTLLVLCYSLYAVGAAALGAGGLAGPVSAGEVVPSQATNSPERTGSDLAFRDVSADAGLEYTATSSPQLRGAQTMISDSGAYVTDFDGDGWRDVLLVGGESPALFENRGGEFGESNALPEINGSVRAALFLDHDRDGLDDLLLLRTADTPVFLENRGGEFHQRDVGFDDPLSVPIGAATADYDGDGCLDVFVIQNGNWATDRPRGLSEHNWSEGRDNGNANVLYVGDCSTFRRADAGITGEHWSLATSFVDLTGDGRPDIHVANDYHNDVVYRNEGDGSFERIVLGEYTNRNGMSSEVADVTGDGRVDVFTTNVWFPDWVNERIARTLGVRAEGNNVLLNRGNGSFVDGGDTYRVNRGGWGWAAVIADFDNDLRRDAFHTTRYMTFEFSDQRFSHQERRAIRIEHDFYRYPVLFERTSGGFSSRSARAVGFPEMDGRGVAAFDYDRDGRTDLLVADATGQFRLLENRADAGTALRLDVRDRNGSSAIGATVTVEAGNRSQFDVLDSNTDFLSQGTRVVHVGTGSAETVTVTVTWPDGTERTFEVRTDQHLVVTPDGIQRRTPVPR